MIRFLEPKIALVSTVTAVAMLFGGTSIGAQARVTPRLDTAALGEFIATRAAADSFSGVVLVARNGVPLWARAIGFADAARSVGNTLETRFDLASAGKMFTGVSVLQLVHQGKVSLDATVGTYLPDYPNAKVRDSVTIAELLTHTSGLGGYFSPAYFERHESIRTTSDLASLFASDSLRFAPGTKFQYSNAGYVVLGLVIERVSGQSYADYVASHVFKPAGMDATGFCRDAARAAPHAIGYTTQTPTGPVVKRVENTPALSACGGPAGGGYSTAADMLRFATALEHHVLLDSAQTILATTGKVDMPTPGLRYGFGFGAQGTERGRFVGHNGAFIGANTEFRIFPDLGYVVVVLSNYDPPAAESVSGRITEEILRGQIR